MASANTLTPAGLTARDSLTFATTVPGNVDRATDFSISIDKLYVINGATLTPLIGETTTALLTNDTTYVAQASYSMNTGEFVLAGGYSLATPDALVLIGNGAQTAVNSTGYQVLTGLAGALTAGDFI